MKPFEEFCFIYLVNGQKIKGVIVDFPFFIFTPSWVKVKTRSHTILINRDSIRTITFFRYVEE